MPILKSFLKDGEAESYRNVEVTFVPGKTAVMTLFEGESAEAREDWVELEKIVLSDYKTKVLCSVLIRIVPFNHRPSLC